MNLQEHIRKILKEETLIPLVIRRRASFEDIEEAFDYALDRMGGSMNNPDSIIYKEKGITLKVFAKFVIDEMVTYLEQDYFNDDNRIYFDNDDYYYNEIRNPLIKYYEKRIKEKFDEVKSDELNESILKEESLRSKLLNNIKEFGVEDTISLVGDFDNFCKVLNIKTPMDFLHLFDDLDVVQSKKSEDLILFRYKPKENFMIYDKNNKEVFIDYDEIWSFLSSNFGLDYQVIQGLTKEWLDEVYNLRGVTTNYVWLWIHGSWMRSTI